MNKFAEWHQRSIANSQLSARSVNFWRVMQGACGANEFQLVE